MKSRALKRLKHKLEFLDEQLKGIPAYAHIQTYYNWEDKPSTPQDICKRAIRDIDKAIKRTTLIDE